MAELRNGGFLVAVALVMVACAPATVTLAPPLPPPPEPLEEREIATVASLLETVDRREYAAAIFTAAGTASDPTLRSHAALAAARVDTPGNRWLMRGLLQDRDTSVAATAAFAAGQLRDTASTASLVQMLHGALGDLGGSVGAEAATALGKIGTDDARQAIASFLLTADVNDPQAGPAVQEALLAAWRAGESRIEPFARWLSARDPEIRWRAVYGLTRRSIPDAVPHLLSTLEDPHPLVRAFSLRGLARSTVVASSVAPDRALGALLAAVQDSAYAVRIDALRTLGTYADAEAVAALEAALTHDAPHEVIAASESLGRLGPAAAAAGPSLRALASDRRESEAVRVAAVEALGSVGGSAVTELLRELLLEPRWRLRAGLARALVGQGAPSLPTLEVLIRDPDPRVAAVAVDAVVAVASQDSTLKIRLLLREALQVSDVQVRSAAIRGLGDLADGSIYPELLDAYGAAQDDEQNDAALAALDALASLRAGTGISPERILFTRFSPPEDHLVRRQAVALFGDAARRAWGDAYPIETARNHTEYRTLIRDWVAPVADQRQSPRVVIDTSAGSIELALFSYEAPLTVASFLELADAGFFDGQQWPRVVPNFVVQGGDPRGDTSGGPGYSIRDEINRRRFGAGTLGMALSGPDTGGSQFFMTHVPQPHLDGGYTVFGEVVVGHEVLERLLPGDVITSVRRLPDSNRELN